MDDARSVLVVGDDALAASVRAELAARGARVLEVATATSREALAAAGSDGCAALVLLADDDPGNLHRALEAARARPAQRIVVRLFSRVLTEQVEGRLGPNVRIVSASAIAAPAFVAACLPDDGAATRRRGVSPLGALAAAVLRDTRLGLLALAFATIALAGAIVVHLVDGRGWVSSAWYAISGMSGGAYADAELVEHGTPIAVLGGTLLAAGLVLLAALIALVSDHLVTNRLVGEGLTLPLRLHGHAVVCGLGTVGFRIAEQLLARGLRVVAVDRRADAQFLAAARRLGVPVLVGDATQTSTLQALRVHHAVALFCVTHADDTNLQAALLGLALRADLPVAVRLADPGFAATARDLIVPGVALSPALLAAPAFADAALGA